MQISSYVSAIVCNSLNEVSQQQIEWGTINWAQSLVTINFCKMSLINILVKVMKLKKQAYSTSCWWEQEVSLMLAEWQHAQCIDCSGTLPTFWWVGSCYSYHFTVVLDLRMIIFASHFWITVRGSCTKTFNSLSIRDGRCLQHGWILRKVQKGGRGHFQFKNLYCRFWTFKQSFLSMKMK